MGENTSLLKVWYWSLEGFAVVYMGLAKPARFVLFALRRSWGPSGLFTPAYFLMKSYVSPSPY